MIDPGQTTNSLESDASQRGPAATFQDTNRQNKTLRLLASDSRSALAGPLFSQLAGSRTPSSTHRPKEGRIILIPTWDGKHHELRLGRVVVKRFRGPAPNQEAILETFERQGWPHAIPDPLPRNASTAAAKRVHDAIYRLNHNQLCPLIRFRGDGQGTGFCWEFRASSRTIILSKQALVRNAPDGSQTESS